MSSHSVETSTVSMRTRSSEQGREGWRGILTGLIPLGLLVVMVLATVLLTTLARLLFAGSGFFAQQRAAVIVLIAGLGVALWTLGATALVIVFPVLLALLLPQHPFP